MSYVKCVSVIPVFGCVCDLWCDDVCTYGRPTWPVIGLATSPNTANRILCLGDPGGPDSSHGVMEEAKRIKES